MNASTMIPIAPSAPAPSLELSIASIEESPSNPRRRFPSDDDLRALGESIKTHGLLQPVLVRPHPLAPKKFQLVFGACRLRAAKLVGLTQIAARCRELSDVESLEIQIIENNKRADVHPLEEAEAYEQLRAKHGYDVDKIAEKVSKSRSHIYQRIKLLALSPEARASVYEGKIPASCALYVARIPSKKHQAEAIEAIAHGQWGDGAMSAREAQEFVTKKYMLKMVDAPFDTKDASLVATAGACSTCPKRTKNAKDFFSDVKTDMCTDADCFSAKHEAHWKRLAEAAKKDGRPVLTTRVDRNGWDNGKSEHVSLDVRCGVDPKSRTYRELLKGAGVPVAIARVITGEVVEAVKREEAFAAMEKKFSFLKDVKEEGREARRVDDSRDVDRMVRELAIAQTVKLVERRQPKAAFLVAIIKALAMLDYELLDAACERRGLGAVAEEALESLKDEAMLRGIIAELVCGEPACVQSFGRDELFAAYGVEQKSFTKVAKSMLAAEAKAAKEKKK